MILTDRTGLDGCGDLWQRRVQRRADQLAARPDPGAHLHPAFDLLGRDAQPRPQAVDQVGHQAHLIGRIGDLGEHPVHQPAVGALLGLQPLGHLHPKLATHLIGGQLPHLGVGVIHLIGQHTETSRAPPLR